MSLINEALKSAGTNDSLKHSDLGFNALMPPKRNGLPTFVVVLLTAIGLLFILWLMNLVEKEPSTPAASETGIVPVALPDVPSEVKDEQHQAISKAEEQPQSQMSIPTESEPVEDAGLSEAQPPPADDLVETSYRVTVIVIGGASRSAVINKQLVGIGDYLPGGARVEEIHSRYVRISIRGRDYFLPIQPL